MPSDRFSEAVLELRTDKGDYEKGLKDAEKTANTFGKRLEQRGKDLEKFGFRASRAGQTLTTGLSLPIAGVGIAAAKSFGDFDSAMTSSLAIMGDVSDSMREEMSQAARDVATSTKFSATEAAEAYFFLASAGMDAEQSIAALPQVAEFAQAGNFDLATATDLLTDSQSALGLTSEDTAENLENQTRVSDVLVKANTDANASVSEFATALTTKAGAAMRQMNIDVESGVAVLAAYADQGTKGSEAGTLLNTTIEGLTRTARTNAAAYDALGVSVFDSNGEMRNMADIVGELEDELGAMSKEQQLAELANLGLTRQARDGAIALIGYSERIRDWERELRVAGDTTADVSERQMQTFSAQLGLLKDELVDVGIELGSELVPVLVEDVLPAVRSTVDAVASGVRWFGQLPQPIKTGAMALAGLTAATGPLLLGVGKVSQSVGLLGIGLGKLAGGSAIGAVTGGLAGPAGLVALLVGAGAAAWTLKRRTEDATTALMEFNRVSQDSRKAASQLINVFKNEGPEGMDRYLKSMKPTEDQLRDLVKALRAQARQVKDFNDGDLLDLLESMKQWAAENRIVRSEMKKSGAVTSRLGDDVSDLGINTRDTTEDTEDHTAAVVTNWETLEGWGEVLDEDEKKLDKTRDVLDLFIADLDEATDRAKSHTEALKERLELPVELQLIEEEQAYRDWLAAMFDVSRVTVDQIMERENLTVAEQRAALFLESKGTPAVERNVIALGAQFEIMQAIARGDYAEAIRIAAEANDRLTEAVGDTGEELSGIEKLFSGDSALGQGITGALGGLLSGDSVVDSVESGLSTGLAMGMNAITPALGTLAQPLVSALSGLLTSVLGGIFSEANAREVAEKFGFHLTDALADEIDRLAEEDFGGDLDAAFRFKLDEVIRENRPATLAAASATALKIREIFTSMDLGNMSPAETLDGVQRSMSALLPIVEELGGDVGVLDDVFADLVNRIVRGDIEMEAGAATINDLINLAQELGLEGTNAWIKIAEAAGIGVDAMTNAERRAAEARQAWRDFAVGGGASLDAFERHNRAHFENLAQQMGLSAKTAEAFVDGMLRNQRQARKEFEKEIRQSFRQQAIEAGLTGKRVTEFVRANMGQRRKEIRMAEREERRERRATEVEAIDSARLIKDRTIQLMQVTRDRTLQILGTIGSGWRGIVDQMIADGEGFQDAMVGNSIFPDTVDRSSAEFGRLERSWAGNLLGMEDRARRTDLSDLLTIGGLEAPLSVSTSLPRLDMDAWERNLDMPDIRPSRSSLEPAGDGGSDLASRVARAIEDRGGFADGGGDIYIENVIELEGRELDRRTIRVTREAIATGQIPVRSDAIVQR